MRTVNAQSLQRSPYLGTNGFPLQSAAVYGPIHSRRYGYSLGINPLPVSYKFCDFDCVYCQYGWTPRPQPNEKQPHEKLKSADELLSEIDHSFQIALSNKTPVDVITIAGNGEPTLHPQFSRLVDGLLDLRDQYFPKVRIGILSDSSQCYRLEIRQALAKLDDRSMKLDAGDWETVQKVNRPLANFDWTRTLRSLEALKDITLQTLFVQGSCDNTSPRQIESWIEAVRLVRPKSVQVYTVDRPPADAGIRPVSVSQLRTIAEQCEAATHIPTEWFE